MVDLKISFSKYDYFGIIFPGILLLIGFFLVIPTDVLINYGSLIDSFGELKFVFIFLIGLSIIFISYLIGIIISEFGAWLIEKKIIGIKLNYPSHNLFQDSYKGKFESYRKPYSKTFQNQFNKIFNSYFENVNYQEDEDKFKLCFTIVKEKCPIAFARLNTFIALYGLSRNLSIAFLLLIPVFLYNLIVFLNLPLIIFIIICPLLSFFCFLNFLKFFRIYADEVFRSFYVYGLEIEKLKKRKEKS